LTDRTTHPDIVRNKDTRLYCRVKELTSELRENSD
jgi:hypothetical protein